MLTFQARLLERAIKIAGGMRPLSIRLGIEEGDLKFWSEDKASMPGRVFLSLADLILEDDIARAAQDRRNGPRLGQKSFDQPQSRSDGMQHRPAAFTLRHP